MDPKITTEIVAQYTNYANTTNLEGNEIVDFIVRNLNLNSNESVPNLYNIVYKSLLPEDAPIELLNISNIKLSNTDGSTTYLDRYLTYIYFSTKENPLNTVVAVLSNLLPQYPKEYLAASTYIILYNNGANVTRSGVFAAWDVVDIELYPQITLYEIWYSLYVNNLISNMNNTLENKDTSIIKYAYDNNIPSRFVSFKNNTYKNSFNEISIAMHNNLSLPEIMNVGTSNGLSEDDVFDIMYIIYYRDISTLWGNVDVTNVDITTIANTINEYKQYDVVLQMYYISNVLIENGFVDNALQLGNMFKKYTSIKQLQDDIENDSIIRFISVYSQKGRILSELYIYINADRDSDTLTVKQIMAEIHSKYGKIMDSHTESYLAWDLLIKYETLGKEVVNNSSLHEISDEKYDISNDLPVDVFHYINKTLSSGERFDNYNTFLLRNPGGIYYIKIQLNTKSFYNNISALKDSIDELELQLENAYRNNVTLLYKIAYSSDVLSRMFALPHSSFSVTSQQLLCNPLYNNGVPETGDGIDIFNDVKTSSSLPLCVYVDKSNNKYYKVYTGSVYGNEWVANSHNNSFLHNFVSNVNVPDTVYVVVWWDPKNKLTRGSYVLYTYELENNTLKVNLNNENTVAITTILQSSFTTLNLNFPSASAIDLQCTFNVYNIKLDYSTFTYLCSTDNIFLTYFKLHETNSVAASHNYIQLHHVRSDVVVIIRSLNTGGSSVVNLSENGIDKNVQFEEAVDYLQIDIQKLQYSADVEFYVQLFTRLFSYYIDTNSYLNKNYTEKLNISPPVVYSVPPSVSESRRSSIDSTVSEMSTLSTLSINSNTSRVSGEISQLIKEVNNIYTTEHRRIAVWQKVDPILKKDFARAGSQAKFQPIVIPNLNAAKYNEGIKRILGPKPGIEALPFTLYKPDQADNTRYVAYKTIHFGCPDVDNSFPYYKVNSKGSSNNVYKVVPCCGKRAKFETEATAVLRAEGKLNEKVGAVGKNISRNKVFPESLVELLSGYSVNSADWTVLDVIGGVNNSIHSILLALNRRDYVEAKLQERNEIVMNERKRISSNTNNWGVIMQECWNRPDYIKEWTDNTVNLDIALYYRLFQVVYNCNIVLLNESGIVTPPHWKVHIPTYNPNAETILLLYNNGVVAGVIAETTTPMRTVWNSRMGEYLYHSYRRSNNIVMWYDSKMYNNYIGLRDYNNWFSNDYKCVEQHIDEYGKLRGLNFIKSDGTKHTISTPPGAPLYLPTSNEVHSTMFTNVPTGYVARSERGLWYSTSDVKYSIHLRVTDYKNIPIDISFGPVDPLWNTGFNIVSQYRIAQRSAYIIFQLIKWAYIVNKAYGGTDFNNILFVNNDSKYQYDLKNVVRKLPASQSLKECLNYIRSVTNGTLCDGTRIIIRSIDLKNKIVRKLQIYDENTEGMIYNIPENVSKLNGLNDSEVLEIPKYIQKYYNYTSDYTQWRNTVILLGSENYNKWYIHTTYSDLPVYKQISTEMSAHMEPYILMDEVENIYMVQNTNSLQSSLAISDTFRELNCNKGYGYTDSELRFNDYILFGVENSKLGTLSENGVAKNLALKYDNGKYAAVLLI